MTTQESSEDYLNPAKHPEREYIGKTPAKVLYQVINDRHDYARRKAGEKLGILHLDDRLADEPDFDVRFDVDRE